MTTKTEQLIVKHGPFGVSHAGMGGQRHVVHRSTYKTLCGRQPVSIFGVDLESRRQITCMRCYKLAFASVNASARHIPDTPMGRVR